VVWTAGVRLLVFTLIIALGATTGHASNRVSHYHSNARIARPAMQTAGVLKISDWQFPSSMNPFQSNCCDVNGRLDRLLWEPLIGWNANGQPFGDLAVDVPTMDNGEVTDGGLTVTLHLKTGLRWSDGQVLTSADVLFGWQVRMDPATGPACSGSCDVISSIDTPDPTTAVLHFRRVVGDYLARLPDPLPSHAFSSASQAASTLEGPSYDYTNASYATSGPYQVSEFVKDDRITFAPNKYYSGTVGPYIQSIIFVFYADKASMMAAAAAGNTDETQDYATSDIAALRQSMGRYSISVTPSFDTEQLVYNAAVPPLNDVKVREALNMAIDRTGLCTSALSTDAATCSTLMQNGPVSQASTFHIAPSEPAYDPTAAQALLASSSYSGQTITLVTTSGNPVRAAELSAIVANWTKIGVHASVQYVPAATLFGGWDAGGTLARGDFQAAVFALRDGFYPDSWSTTYSSQYIPSATNTNLINQNVGRVSDQQIDSDFAQATSSVDANLRRSLFADMAQRVVDQAYMLALYNRPNIVTRDANLGNFFPSPQGGANTWNVFEWYAATGYSGVAATYPPAHTGDATPTPTATPIPTHTPEPKATATSLPTPTPPARQVAFTFDGLSTLNTSGHRTQSFRLNSAVLVNARYTVRNVKDTVTMTVRRTYAYRRGKLWHQIGHAIAERFDTSKGTHVYQFTFVPQQFHTQRISLGITVGGQTKTRSASITVTR
jgi:peptide/nickel transport system substrate-binding protein